MPRYLLKVEGKISGPHSEVALQEMASVRAFDDSALITLEPTEGWTPVRDLSRLNAELFPARKTISLKAKAIETVPQENNELISIDKILHDNLVAEAKTPFKPMARRPNRRRRDFLYAVIVLNCAIGAAYHYLPRTREIEIAAGSAAALVTIGLYWFFYQIMDRY